jgi:hypothetical protein
VPDIGSAAALAGPAGGLATAGALLYSAAQTYKSGRRERVTEAEDRAAKAEKERDENYTELGEKLARVEREVDRLRGELDNQRQTHDLQIRDLVASHAKEVEIYQSRIENETRASWYYRMELAKHGIPLPEVPFRRYTDAGARTDVDDSSGRDDNG